MVLGKEDPAAYLSFTGKYAYRGLIPMNKAVDLLGDELARSAIKWIGKQGHILALPIEKGEVMNVVAFKTKKDGKWDNEHWVLPQDRKGMEDDHADWGDSVKKIVSLMEKSDVWALFDYRARGGAGGARAGVPGCLTFFTFMCNRLFWRFLPYPPPRKKPTTKAEPA